MDNGASASITNLQMMNQEVVKLDRFDGCTYARWADKMKFLLILLKDEEKVAELEKLRMIRKEDETIC
ncbi:Copia-like retrotransposon [Artemisia annua]|uniref:Copia-like retrotransposon n=1 Tax=Artemisia annua TaxID=35608 RepID=A0A2U1L0H4_ARTAN|nr:Copia-like retrotransposon [Artemisia annua]